MNFKYKDLNEIDFTKVCCYEFDEDQYFKDVSLYKIASFYLNLNHVRDRIFDYEIHLIDDPEGKTRNIRINDELNNCLFDFDPINAEKLVMILETRKLDWDDKIDPPLIIKKITGVDLNDYISHVWYEGGGEDFIKAINKK